jgi:transcriptional regulator with XRE-family HTH domain
VATSPKAIFGEILYSLRQKKGISQEGLAANAHLSRDFISKLENGYRMPSLKTIAKLAPHFQLSPAELYQRFLNKLKTEGLFDAWIVSRGQ